MQTLVPLSCFIDVDLSDIVTHMALIDPFRIFLNIFNGKEALQDEKVHHFWN